MVAIILRVFCHRVLAPCRYQRLRMNKWCYHRVLAVICSNVLANGCYQFAVYSIYIVLAMVLSTSSYPQQCMLKKVDTVTCNNVLANAWYKLAVQWFTAIPIFVSANGWCQLIVIAAMYSKIHALTLQIIRHLVLANGCYQFAVIHSKVLANGRYQFWSYAAI